MNVTCEKSLGAAFTGGRSTPVYYITAQVTSKKLQLAKTRQFVCKLVMMPGDATNNPSLLQKRESYAVERRFYNCVAPSLRSVLAIPKLLASDHDGTQTHPIACWLMTDVRVQYPLHPTILDPKSHLLRALDWLAQFHVHSWNAPSHAEWRRDLWDRGGFWNKKLPSTNLSTQWLQTCQWLSKHHPSSSISPKSLGGKFHIWAQPLQDFMTRQAQSSTRISTMIHGDFKAANLFFSSSNDNQEENGANAVAAVDFQFSGADVPSEDIAYILFPDAMVDYWDDETSLLEYYHAQLMEGLILANKGGPSSFPYSIFYNLYQLSRLELVLYLLSKGWVASTIGDAKLVTALESTMTRLEECFTATGEYHQALEQFVNGDI